METADEDFALNFERPPLDKIRTIRPPESITLSFASGDGGGRKDRRPITSARTVTNSVPSKGRYLPIGGGRRSYSCKAQSYCSEQLWRTLVLYRLQIAFRRTLRPNPGQHQFKPGDRPGALHGGRLREDLRLLAGAVDGDGLLQRVDQPRDLGPIAGPHLHLGL